MDALLLHGFTHTGASWKAVRAALPRGYRAVTPDLRGHGSASGVQPVSLDGVLDDLAALAARVEPGESFTVGGYSQGGRIALHAALDPRLRGRIGRLVVVGASPGLIDPAERAARRAADERLAGEFETLRIEELAARWAQTPVLSGLPTTMAGQVHEDRLRNSPAGLARALRGLGTGALPSLWERLPEIAVPVTLVVGERDVKFTRVAREMAEALPDSQVRVVAGAGHAVHLEAPHAVAQALLEV